MQVGTMQLDYVQNGHLMFRSNTAAIVFAEKTVQIFTADTTNRLVTVIMTYTNLPPDSMPLELVHLHNTG